MCGRYVTPDEAALERFWTLDRRHWNPLASSVNVAPTDVVPIIRRARDGACELVAARWGLVPHWWNRAKLPSSTFNARSEEVADKPMWRASYRHARCLMPAFGWYEWQALEPVPGRRRSAKQPYYICSETSPVVAFAGLMALWHTPDGERLLSCAVLTTKAAPALVHIHERMPVVLAPHSFAAWLAADTDGEQLATIVEAAQQDFNARPVSASATIANSRAEIP
jgi:putative SOS response-associated peptidase YedK